VFSFHFIFFVLSDSGYLGFLAFVANIDLDKYCNSFECPSVYSLSLSFLFPPKNPLIRLISLIMFFVLKLLPIRILAQAANVNC